MRKIALWHSPGRFRGWDRYKLSHCLMEEPYSSAIISGRKVNGVQTNGIPCGWIETKKRGDMQGGWLVSKEQFNEFEIDNSPKGK